MNSNERNAIDNVFPQRKPNHLAGFDYSTTRAYFVTLCVQNRRNLFWSVGATTGRRHDAPSLSPSGQMVETEICKIEGLYAQVQIEKYCILPDHIHMIVMIGDCSGKTGGRPQVAPTLSRIIQQFKGSITKQIGSPIWQKSFYDHIIRDEEDYENIWQYIDGNPSEWPVEDYCIEDQ